MPLRDLKPDTELRVLHDGALVPARLTDIAITEHVAPSVEVYDLTVQGPEHNFLAEGVLVHNKSDESFGGGAAFLCGNGRIDNEEECDDGNGHSLDGCSRDCKLEPVVQPPTTGSLMTTSSSSTGGFGGASTSGGMGGDGGTGGAGGMGTGGAGIGGSGGS